MVIKAAQLEIFVEFFSFLSFFFVFEGASQVLMIFMEEKQGFPITLNLIIYLIGYMVSILEFRQAYN